MRIPLLFCCLFLAACSSVSVIEEKENTALAPKSAPSELLVRPFEVSKGARFDVASAEKGEDTREKVGRTIAMGVLSRGERWIAPCRIIGKDTKLPREGLLVEGRVLVAQQGSRALRLGIGLGFGRTHMDTTVRVFNLAASAKEPWLTCKTTGGSNMEPGFIFGLAVPSPMVIPVIAGIAGGAVSTVTRSNKGVTQDAKRTGRAVTGVVHDRLVVRGLVPRKAWPKRGGTLGTPAGVIKLPEI